MYELTSLYLRWNAVHAVECHEMPSHNAVHYSHSVAIIGYNSNTDYLAFLHYNLLLEY